MGKANIKKIRKIAEKIPVKWTRVGNLKDLLIYPLKSGRGIKSNKLYCTKKGLKQFETDDGKLALRDRSFIIYCSKDYEVITPRGAEGVPKTVLVGIRSAEKGVVLSAPMRNDVYVPVQDIRNDVCVKYAKECFTCTDCGTCAARWLREFLSGEHLRLGYGDGQSLRDIEKIYKHWTDHYKKADNDLPGIFSDFAALHLITQASVDDLNKRLPEPEDKVTVLNFRPNLVIDDTWAHEEDDWNYIKIGSVVAKNCMECPRCDITTVSPKDGTKNKNHEPIMELTKYRMSSGPFRYPVLGVYLKVVQPGIITSGDDVFASIDDDCE